jgi:hypothetical protein
LAGRAPRKAALVRFDGCTGPATMLGEGVKHSWVF